MRCACRGAAVRRPSRARGCRASGVRAGAAGAGLAPPLPGSRTSAARSSSCSARASVRCRLRTWRRSASTSSRRTTPRAVADAASRRSPPTGCPCVCACPRSCSTTTRPGWRALLALPWQAVYARHLGVLRALADDGAPDAVLEFPLQGLSGLAAGVAGALTGAARARVVVSPESSLEEIGRLPVALADDLGHAPPALEVARLRPPAGAAHARPAGPRRGAGAGARRRVARRARARGRQGLPFPADVDAGGTRLFNARVTNLAGNARRAARGRRGDVLVVTGGPRRPGARRLRGRRPAGARRRSRRASAAPPATCSAASPDARSAGDPRCSASRPAPVVSSTAAARPQRVALATSRPRPRRRTAP